MIELLRKSLSLYFDFVMNTRNLHENEILKRFRQEINETNLCYISLNFYFF